jgi:hypothetical protein
MWVLKGWSRVRMASLKAWAAIMMLHSKKQGAMLAAIVVGQALAPPQAGSRASSIVRPKCAILSGAAWPNPFGDLFLSLNAAVAAANSKGGGGGGPATIPTLHCWGLADDVNPPEMAKRLQVTGRAHIEILVLRSETTRLCWKGPKICSSS